MTKNARMYGESLYELAAEEKLTDVLLEQIVVIRRIFRENPEYLRILAEPSISQAERKDLIEAAFAAQAEPYLVNFIKLLCEHNLLRDFFGCCEAFIQRCNIEHGIAEAVVTSAVPLTVGQINILREKLEKISGKSIRLIQNVDCRMLAGVRVELEGKELDGTVQGRLSDMARKLAENIV